MVADMPQYRRIFVSKTHTYQRELTSSNDSPQKSQLSWDTLDAGLDVMNSEVSFSHELDTDMPDEGALLLGEVAHVDGADGCG